MSVLLKRSALALLVILPFAAPASAQDPIDEESNCVQLVGYGGTAPAPSLPGFVRLAQGVSASPGSLGGSGGGILAAGVCAAENARPNGPFPTRTGTDFVPITGDDSLGFYCVYGVKASVTGGIGGNVSIFILELVNDEVLLFGSGYGNIQGANLFDAAYDMERVDQVIRFCMGKNPATTPLRMVAPHGHGDHINPACNRELERLGYDIVEIAFHPGDAIAIASMTWTQADRALFRVLPSGQTCLQELASYASPLGKIWFFERPGHTPGSIDAVIDIRNDPTNRFVLRGSQPSAPCAPLSGQREIVNAHGNMELLSVRPTLTDVSPLSGSSLGGARLTLTGLSFRATGAGTHDVRLSGRSATNVVVVNDTTLTCDAPIGPPGELVEVAVVNNNGQAVLASTFYYEPLPTVTSVSPVSGDWRGGAIVQVRGSGFLGMDNEVFFGANRATAVSVKSNVLLTARVPSGTPGATVTVTVRNGNGQASLPGAYRYNPDITIVSASPPSASALGGNDIVLTGTSFTGNGGIPVVTFGGESATGVARQSDTRLTCVTPAGTPGAIVDVTVTNSSGTAVLTGFRFHATPALASISPAGGRASGGTSVTLTGSGLSVDGADVNTVRFGGIPAIAVVVHSDGSLTCTTPPGALDSTVNVTVSNQNGTATLPSAYHYRNDLALDSLAPASGTAQGGTIVTIVGNGFQVGAAGPTTVTFGGVPAAQVNVTSDTRLSCSAPAGAPQSVVSVTISNGNGTVVAAAAYRYHAVPVLASLTPNHGHAGSPTSVVLSGTGFLADDAGSPLVLAGGVAATDIVVLSDTQVQCKVPAGTPGASVDVRLVNQNGQVTSTRAFRYHTLPTLGSCSPTSSAAAAQANITLTGTGYLNDSAGAPTIRFGSLLATGVSVTSDTSVRCTSPVGTPGQTVDVQVTNARGTATLPGAYRFYAAPAITALSPTIGTYQGGTLVTLSGSGFVADSAGTNTITFGGAAATNVVVVDNGSLRCNAPPGTRNAVVDVRVTNTNGAFTLAGAFSYSVAPPSVLALAPASGPGLVGTSLQLTGSGFLANSAGPNQVRFGGVAATAVTVADDTRLTCQAPPGTPGTRVNVEVVNANGSGTLVQGFRYHARPGLVSIDPPSVRASGGVTLTLTGSGFAVDSPGTNRVTFGGVPATNVVGVSDTTLTCVAPAGTTAATVPVVIGNGNGDSNPLSFSYNSEPVLFAISPRYGVSAGGTVVTLTGSGFLGANAGTNAVRFDTQHARNVVVLNDTTLTCETPRGFPGLVDVTLWNANGTAVLPQGFRYGRPPPEITSVEPAHGTALGGTVVTVKGRGFADYNAGLNRVRFGNAFATNVIVLDDETALCTAPVGMPGETVEVGVNNLSGSAFLAAGYRYHSYPTLVTVTPPEGEPLGKTRVTLIGSGFLADAPGETRVLFGVAPANDVVVIDDQHIRCVPMGKPNTTFDVTVKNVNGKATLPNAYRIVGEFPSLEDVNPDWGPYLGGTAVELRGHGFQGGALEVRFGSAPALDVILVSDELIRCTTPPGELGKSVNVQIKTKKGGTALVGGFTYESIPPELTRISPQRGPSAGGTRVTLTGLGFTALGAGSTRVTFGDVDASAVTVVNDTTVTCDAPAGVPGESVTVVLANDNSQDQLPKAFLYNPLPTLLSVTPDRGPATGDTLVSLTGTGFTASNAGAVSVRFGNAAATSVSVVSDTLLTCRTPAGTANAHVDVRVSNLNGAATLSSAYRYNIHPHLTSVTPARGEAVGGTLLELTGSGFTADQSGTNTVRIGGVPALEVTTVDDTRIRCTTPPGTPGAPVAVEVANSNGSHALASAFMYFAPPALVALTPDHGLIAGGTSVSLVGSGFLADGFGSNLVLFGGFAAHDVVEVSDTELTCTSPAGSSGGTVDVTLANENGSAILVRAFRYHGPPTLSAVTPNHGSANAPAEVTLSGSGFLDDDAGATKVRFGGVEASGVIVVDDATLTCRPPTGVAGTRVDVSLANANGASTLPASFRYHTVPVITNVAPNRGAAAGGTSVTITGSGFLDDDAGRNLVMFGGIFTKGAIVEDDRTLTCTTPPGFPNTLVDVQVTNANGAVQRTNGFRYNALPRLTGVAPAAGPAAGGNRVTLTGSGFAVGNPGLNRVLFGSTPANDVVVVNDSSLTCLAPGGLAGTVVALTLTNDNGSDTLVSAYRYSIAPTLTSLAPPSGPAQGGTLVTLTGVGFADPQAGATLVTFGGVAATNVVVLGNTTVRCNAPSGPAGTLVAVVLANDNGSASLAAAFRYHALPVLTQVLPARGSSAASSTVTLGGAGFTADGAGTNTVLFGTQPALVVTPIDDATLLCEVAPQGAGSVVDVSVANANGTAVRPAAFAFDAPAPTLAAIAPTSGFASGGTPVTLTGTGFQLFSAGVNTVTFAGSPATDVVAVDDTTLTCRTPAGTVGASVDVVVSNVNGSAGLAAAFTYLTPPPVLTAVIPAGGRALGGSTVTLSGSGFSANGAGTNTVSFGGIAPTALTVVDDATLTCVAPAGTAGSAVTVSVSNANGSTQLAPGYRYHALPVITSISPADGTSLGGTLVTVRGSGFQADAPGTNVVRFNGVAATSVVVFDDGRLTCRAPSGPADSTVAVKLTNDNGEVELASAYRYHSKPTLTGVAPDNGSPLGGTAVTLTGTGFRSEGAVVNIVSFGGIAASSVNVVNNTTITCTAPPGTSGLAVLVTVANVNGTAQRANGFRYDDRPALTALDPAQGPAAGGTDVTLTGTHFLAATPGTTTVTFGAAAASQVVVASDTQITCTTPPGTAGAVADVVVSNDNGSVTLTAAFTYETPIPLLGSVVPNRGSTGGATTVTLGGSGFVPGTQVTFGGALAQRVLILDEHTIQCVTPPSAADSWVDIGVVGPRARASLPLAFRYVDPPRLTAVEPPVGTPEGGSVVVLVGSGFRDGDAGENHVSFGGIPATGVVVLDDEHLACELPAGPLLTEADVAVTNENGTAALPRAFRWQRELDNDLNRDGRGDVVVGSEHAERVLGGAVRVFFGAPLPLDDQAQAERTVLDASHAGFGRPVASGDLDGDHVPELVVGSLEEGAVYVFGGPLEAVSEVLQTSAARHVLRAGESDAGFGCAIVVRDVDNDGTADLLVGATTIGASTVGASAGGSGSVHLFRGGAALASGEASRVISAEIEGFAQSLGVGDLDGDGWPEIVVGAPGAPPHGALPGLRDHPGSVLVYRGGPEAFRSGAVDVWIALDGEASGDRFGSSLAVGDFDGDGRDDLAVGAPGSTRSGAASGAVFLYAGSSSFAATARASAVLAAESAGDRFGAALATGEADGDARAELLVGAPGHRGAGRVYLFLGAERIEDGWAGSADAVLEALAGSAGEFGARVAMVDVDGTGRDDMIVESPSLEARDAAGRVFVFSSTLLGPRDSSGADGTFRSSPTVERPASSTKGDL